ncbi:MAG: imidazole glycerol phosphate synthase subunit HisH [Candidatus Ranarchaeia archaeon]
MSDSKPLIAILDYGAGNLYSITKALERLGAKVEITNFGSRITTADGFVLPGVGAFKDAMSVVQRYKTDIQKAIDKQMPILGICLGLQLFFEESFEGGRSEGLGFLKGKVVKLPDNEKVPHIGWNNLKIHDTTHPIVRGVPDDGYVYFVHSYVSKPVNNDIIISTCSYSTVFPAIIAKDNLIATQFHPEKSSRVGLQILKNFFEMTQKYKIKEGLIDGSNSRD